MDQWRSMLKDVFYQNQHQFQEEQEDMPNNLPPGIGGQATEAEMLNEYGLYDETKQDFEEHNQYRAALIEPMEKLIEEVEMELFSKAKEMKKQGLEMMERYNRGEITDVEFQMAPKANPFASHTSPNEDDPLAPFREHSQKLEHTLAMNEMIESLLRGEEPHLKEYTPEELKDNPYEAFLHPRVRSEYLSKFSPENIPPDFTFDTLPQLVPLIQNRQEMSLKSAIFDYEVPGIKLQESLFHDKTLQENFTEIHRRAITEKEPEAMLLLGALYHKGLGPLLKQDYEMAFYWYKQAANHGNPAGCFGIGLFYEDGLGVTEDYEKALYWYSKAAEKDHPQAKHKYGIFLVTGKTGYIDEKEGAFWIKSAAEDGDPHAMLNAGRLYHFGVGMPVSPIKAFLWYKLSAENNFPEGIVSYGLCLKVGFGCAQNLSQAFHQFGRVAVIHPLALLNLGYCYYHGWGTEANGLEALRCFSMVAELDNAEALHAMGIMMGDGYVMAPNFSRAMQFFEQAAYKGFPHAMFKMGLAYKLGWFMPQDTTRAAFWLTLGARLGEENCTEELEREEWEPHYDAISNFSEFFTMFENRGVENLVQDALHQIQTDPEAYQKCQDTFQMMCLRFKEDPQFERMCRDYLEEVNPVPDNWDDKNPFEVDEDWSTDDDVHVPSVLKEVQLSPFEVHATKLAFDEAIQRHGPDDQGFTMSDLKKTWNDIDFIVNNSPKRRRKRSSKRREDQTEEQEPTQTGTKTEPIQQTTQTGTQRTQTGTQRTQTGTQRTQTGTQRTQTDTQRTQTDTQRTQTDTQRTQTDTQRTQTDTQRTQTDTYQRTQSDTQTTQKSQQTKFTESELEDYESDEDPQGPTQFANGVTTFSRPRTFKFSSERGELVSCDEDDVNSSQNLDEEENMNEFRRERYQMSEYLADHLIPDSGQEDEEDLNPIEFLRSIENSFQTGSSARPQPSQSTQTKSSQAKEESFSVDYHLSRHFRTEQDESSGAEFSAEDLLQDTTLLERMTPKAPFSTAEEFHKWKNQDDEE